MSTRGKVANADGPARSVPYEPSLADRFLAWLDRLPGPTWLAFIGLGLISVLYVEGALFAFGRDLSIVGLRFAVLALTPAGSLALMHHLNRVASDALDRFRPLLEIDDGSVEVLRFRLTVQPASVILVIWAATALGTVTNSGIAPANFEIDGVPLPGAVLMVGYACVVGCAYSAVALQIIRQLVYVAGIHRDASYIDLFNSTPLHAFSRLTSRAALGLLTLVVALAATTLPQFASASSSPLATAGAIGLYASLGIAAVASFVLPLYGLQQRIAAEKERLQVASGARLSAVLAEVDRDVRSADLARADAINKRLASVLAEREMLARLPTWPWQAATLRGFISALLLPVLVYVLARATERVVL